MNLVIFGDSYADVNGDEVRLASWPNLLKRKIPNTYIKGMCGTSIWWSYKNFTEYIRSANKPDCMIFCHTNPHRWPSLPKDIEGASWSIYNEDGPIWNIPPLLRTINPYYFDLFPQELSRFIASNVFREVNEYCRQNNIYLINILCFNDNFDCATEFPVIRNIDKISHYERLKYNGKIYSVMDFISKFELRNGDPRICHFGDKNNSKLAEILYNMLTTKQSNTKIEAFEHIEWDQFDDSNDTMFRNILEK